MSANMDKTDAFLISLGAALHQAALTSKAIIDAIPENASIGDEVNSIESAISSADAIARQIMRTSSLSSAAYSIASRACAWLDGDYWEAVGEAA